MTFREDATRFFRLHQDSTREQVTFACAEHLRDLAALSDTKMRAGARRTLTEWLKVEQSSPDHEIMAAVRARLTEVAGLDQHAASLMMHELVTERADERKIDRVTAARQIAAELPELAEVALPTPVRPTSMSHNRNEVGDPGRVPAPARPATALGVAEQKIREHLALTGQTDRRKAIRDLLASGLPTDVKDALRALLTQDTDPRETMRGLVEKHMSEKNVDYATALKVISGMPEHQELTERVVEASRAN